jgi:methyl-accepting chemotaxis protein
VTEESFENVLEALDAVRDLRRSFGDLTKNYDDTSPDEFNAMAYDALTDAEAQLQEVESALHKVSREVAE